MVNMKYSVKKWKNGVGERIEKMLKKTYDKIDSVIGVQQYNCGIGEYSMKSTNN